MSALHFLSIKHVSLTLHLRARLILARALGVRINMHYTLYNMQSEFTKFCKKAPFGSFYFHVQNFARIYRRSKQPFSEGVTWRVRAMYMSYLGILIKDEIITEQCLNSEYQTDQEH